MSVREVFKKFVEPSLERIPVMEVAHMERLNGHDHHVTHVVHRNVFTEVDRKLSRHLAATRGAGFPAFTVAVQVSGAGDSEALELLNPIHYDSVPHALKGIATRAFAGAEKAELTVHNNDPSTGARSGGMRRTLTLDDLDALESALEVCGYLGEPEFLTISGDYDVVIVGPPGDQRPIIMYLRNGNLAMPCSNGEAITPFECPLHGFASHVAKNAMPQSYVAQARHALMATKEAAVMEFRATMEARIVGFSRALANRPLDGARLEIASGLIARLKAGLGDSLHGLSEEAQLAALDWSSAIGPEAGLQGAVTLGMNGAREAQA